MSLERELAALNRRLNDLKRRQEAIHMRVFTRNHDEPYPADARDGELVVTIEAPIGLARRTGLRLSGSKNFADRS